jgi:hypothetical protein
LPYPLCPALTLYTIPFINLEQVLRFHCDIYRLSLSSVAILLACPAQHLRRRAKVGNHATYAQLAAMYLSAQ